MPDVLLLGSTDITLAVGEALLEVGVKVAGVVTVGESFSISYSDRPLRNMRFADVPLWCEQQGLPAIGFEGYDSLLDRLGSDDIPLCLVAGWYHMVPRTFRETFSRGCAGLHASLLPQLRGGAPLNWAILTGLTETGVTLLQLTDGVDDGPIYGQKRFPIGSRSTIAELVEASAKASADLVQELIPGIVDGTELPAAQAGSPSYGLQRSREDGRIEWTGSTDEIDRLVRAAGRPYSGAFTFLEGERIYIWASAPVSDRAVVHGAPGQLAKIPGIETMCVVTKDGLLGIEAATDGQGNCVLELLRRSNQKRLTF